VRSECALARVVRAVFVGIVVGIVASARVGAQAPAGPLLLQRPRSSRTLVAFSYGGDIWTVARAGGSATRLTAGEGNATDPMFSPDGGLIAFTGDYDGNADVYVVAASGGVPRRLTYHPARDEVVGWTPDGASILFRSGRTSFSRYSDSSRCQRTVVRRPRSICLGAMRGRFPRWEATGVYAIRPANEIWKRYRGGEASEIWLTSLADGAIERVPRDGSNDASPDVVGGPSTSCQTVTADHALQVRCAVQAGDPGRRESRP